MNLRIAAVEQTALYIRVSVSMLAMLATPRPSSETYQYHTSTQISLIHNCPVWQYNDRLVSLYRHILPTEYTYYYKTLYICVPFILRA